ncbi:MAG: MFS transporter [Erysipelotrichaceae bacterium]|nr:MFS transporter [Erysipelotrichaceae bacterium]
MSTKLGWRKWLTFILAGFVGQLAWSIENNYLNVYVFDVTARYDFIPVMTIASAAAATITTLFMGALSDRLGKRKLFISFGYILWGISIFLFAFLDPTSSLNIVANNVFLAGTMIVIIDCLMTFFGSSANDAAFNAFVTDTTSENNRGKVESVLSILPLLALIIVIVIAGFFVDVPVGEIKRWNMFFYVFGGITLLVGIASLFLIPKDTAVPNKANYWGNVIYGFRPKVIKENPVLYTTLLAFTVFNIGLQVFMPYFILYVQNVLLITGSDFTICLGIVLLVASALTVIFGLFMDKIGKNKIMIPALIVGALGGMLVFLVPASQAITKVGMVIGGTILMTGYLVSTAVLGAKIRDYTPSTEVGLFQGVRMIFCVLVPMVIGPLIAQALCQIGGESYTNEFGQLVYPPNKWLFFVTGVIFLMAIVPVIFMMKKERQIINEK